VAELLAAALVAVAQAAAPAPDAAVAAAWIADSVLPARAAEAFAAEPLVAVVQAAAPSPVVAVAAPQAAADAAWAARSRLVDPGAPRVAQQAGSPGAAVGLQQVDLLEAHSLQSQAVH